MLAEDMMNTDPKSRIFSKFLRGSARESGTDGTECPPTNEPWRASWPDIERLFSQEPWRAVKEFFHDPFAGRGALERWFGEFSSPRFQPRIDVVDEGKVLRVTAKLQGIEREDLNVSVEDGAIVLRGEKKQDVRSEEDGCYRLERAHGSFVRTIPMPDNADPDHALARFANGVLTLTVPKSEPTRTTRRTIYIG